MHGRRPIELGAASSSSGSGSSSIRGGLRIGRRRGGGGTPGTCGAATRSSPPSPRSLRGRARPSRRARGGRRGRRARREPPRHLADPGRAERVRPRATAVKLAAGGGATAAFVTGPLTDLVGRCRLGRRGRQPGGPPTRSLRSTGTWRRPSSRCPGGELGDSRRRSDRRPGRRAAHRRVRLLLGHQRIRRVEPGAHQGLGGDGVHALPDHPARCAHVPRQARRQGLRRVGR